MLVAVVVVSLAVGTVCYVWALWRGDRERP